MSFNIFERIQFIEPPPTMDIKTPPQTQVEFAYPDNGRDGEQEEAAKLLKPNELYTVEKIMPGQSTSYVYLVEVPDVAFNTVFFKNIEE